MFAKLFFTLVTTFSNFYINDKSDEERRKWQRSLISKEYETMKKRNGIICIQSPTGSGKTKGVVDLINNNGLNEKTIVVKKNSKEVITQWEKNNIDGIAFHTDQFGKNEFIEKINNKKNFNELEVIIFDEAHENYGLLFGGHSAHIRHQGEVYLSKLKERYFIDNISTIYHLAKEKIVVLVSDTLDSIICEELPVYSGIFPIDIISVSPTENYYNDIPKITYLNNEKANEIHKVIETTHTKFPNKKQIIYTSDIKESEKIVDKLKNRDLVDKSVIEEYNHKKGKREIILYPITFLVNSGESGIDDPEVIKIYSLRIENSTVDSNMTNRLNMSYGFRQRVGRIRKPHPDAEAFTIREDITRESFIDSIKESYKRVERVKYIYDFYSRINNCDYKDMDMISLRIKTITTNILKSKEDYCKKDNSQKTVIQEIKKYMKNEFFKKLHEYIKKKNDFNTISDEFIQEYEDHINKLSEIFKDFFNIDDSNIEKKYHYSDSYIKTHTIKPEKIDHSEQEKIDHSELKKEVYEKTGKKCQITNEYSEIDDLDLARIKEGKDRGKYRIDNVILCEPTIHRLWDREKIIFYIGVGNNIEFKCNVPEYQDKRNIKLIIKNMKIININFKKININNLVYRLENPLSGSYHRKENIIEKWKDSNLEESDDVYTFEELYDAWERWCDDEGYNLKQRPEKKKIKDALIELQKKTYYGCVFGKKVADGCANGTKKQPKFNFRPIDD